MARDTVSIIVPCYLIPDKDRELTRFTRACFESIRKHAPYAELVVIDNNSTVDVDLLTEYADIYLGLEKNEGFAPAVNLGLHNANGDYLVVMNNDVEFIDDWPSTAVAAWDVATGLVSSHLLDADPQRKVGRVVRPPGHFFGALWMISRAVLDEVGMLDEGYERGMFEDKNMAMLVDQADYDLVKVGHCKHIGNATWGKLPHQKKIYLKNKARFEAKWGVS